MTTPTFGIQFSRPEDEEVSVLDPDFSKGLLIAASEDATAATYPFNEPIRISTSDSTAIAALGTGALKDAVSAINSQLSGLNAGADVTILRVAAGADEEEYAANVVAALGLVGDIPAAVNATPRLVWADGTAWRADADTANPVTAALPAALEKLLAISVVDVDSTSSALAIDARETMSSQRIMPIGVAAKVYEGTNLVIRPMGPRIMGLIQRIDNNYSGRPFNPFANRAIYGLAGLSRNIPFSLLDGSTEGQQMLEGNVAIVVSGETGVDGSVSDGGFQFIGTDNCDTGELWQQIHQVRAADFITVKLMTITREFLGLRITADMVEAWLNSIKSMLRDHKSADEILGYNVEFKAANNSTSSIRLGHLLVNIGVEPCPAFTRGDHEIRRYADAVDALVDEIVASQATS